MAGVARLRADRGDINKLAHVVETIQVHRQPLAYRYAELYAGLASAVNGVVLAAQSNASTWA